MVFSANFKGLNVIYFFQNNQITSYQDLYDKLVSYINLNMSIYIKLNYPNNSFLEKIFISYDIISFLLIKMNSYENKKDSSLLTNPSATVGLISFDYIRKNDKTFN